MEADGNKSGTRNGDPHGLRVVEVAIIGVAPVQEAKKEKGEAGEEAGEASERACF